MQAMRIGRICGVVLALGLLTDWALAQEETHQPSPNAMVMQTVGTTDVTITYSRPGVKGRKIWGELQKFGEVWRAGANASTTIEFEKDVKVNGKPVSAGKYGLFILLEEKQWTFILSKDATTRGAYPGEDKDALRIVVTPEAAPMQERLVYFFTDLVDDKPTATVSIHWEKLKASFQIETPAA